MRIARALILGCALACTSQGSEAAERRVDSAGRRDSVAAVAAATMSEGNALALLVESNSADSALGALGSLKGSSTDVKEYGRMILREHHALAKDAMDAGRELGVALTPPLVPADAPAPASYRELLDGAAGAAWDRAYLEYAILLHESALENHARALAATRQPRVKELIEKAVPILQKHIDKAKSLTKSLPKAVNGNAARKR